MRYYKLTKNNFTDALKVGKIYPENFREWGLKYCDIGYFVNYGYAHFFEEVSAGEYFVQEGKMPEYFAIKRVADNYLWEKYISWLNKEYSTDWSGNIRHCFYGFGEDKITHGACNSIKKFGENSIELTLEQWDQIINKNMKDDKEIIGWKLKEDCEQYEQAALNIVNQSKFYNFAEGYNFSTNSENESTFKKAGVLELWFAPVYKEKILRFGGCDVIFEKVTSGVRITCNGETGTFSQIQAIYNFFKGSSASFKFGSQEVKEVKYPSASWKSDFDPEPPTSIKIGCTTGAWEEFVAIYEKAKSML